MQGYRITKVEGERKREKINNRLAKHLPVPAHKKKINDRETARKEREKNRTGKISKVGKGPKTQKHKNSEKTAFPREGRR